MKNLLKYIMIILGSAILSLGLCLFLVPLKIAPGGVSGLSTVLHYVTGVPVGALILIINIPIFIFGAINFNRRFILISLFGMLLLSFFTSIFENFKPITNDVILASVFGGAFSGVGAGLVFRYGATTGGTDIVVMLLKKRFRNFSTGNFVAIVDAVVVTLAGLVFKTWETVLYSTLSLIVASYMVDAIVEGVDYAKSVLIISEKAEEISKGIFESLQRGTTCLSGISHYTGREKHTLLCVVRRFEISRLKKIVYETDKDAFVIVTDTKEVLGRGFKNY